MKRIFRFFSLVILGLLLTSCSKVGGPPDIIKEDKIGQTETSQEPKAHSPEFTHKIKIIENKELFLNKSIYLKLLKIAGDGTESEIKGQWESPGLPFSTISTEGKLTAHSLERNPVEVTNTFVDNDKERKVSELIPILNWIEDVEITHTKVEVGLKTKVTFNKIFANGERTESQNIQIIDVSDNLKWEDGLLTGKRPGLGKVRIKLISEKGLEIQKEFSINVLSASPLHRGALQLPQKVTSCSVKSKRASIWYIDRKDSNRPF